MTTTAHEDQFTDAPEPVRQPYNAASILRRNVADLELALREQTERAEKAEAELLAVREDNHSMMGEILSLRERTEIAESELEKLRQQEPVLVMCGGYEWRTVAEAEHFCRVNHASHPIRVFYANPIPAPAVPEEWRNIVTKMLGWWDAPVMTMSQGKFIAEKARALLQSTQQANAVPADWRAVMQEAHDTFQRYADLHRAKDTRDSHEKAKVNQKLANKLYALLQSAEVTK